MKNALFFLLLVGSISGYAQKMVSEKSEVSFFSKAAIEDIKAHTGKSSSIINTSTNDIVFVIPIADFEFVKSLMREHFNEKYMDTEKFPKATFEGKLSGLDLKATGTQQAIAKGKMNIHGVTKDVEIPGTVSVVGGKIELQSKFMVKLADYDITIPKLLFKNIAEQVEVTVAFTYKPQ